MLIELNHSILIPVVVVLFEYLQKLSFMRIPNRKEQIAIERIFEIPMNLAKIIILWLWRGLNKVIQFKNTKTIKCLKHIVCLCSCQIIGKCGSIRKISNAELLFCKCQLPFCAFLTAKASRGWCDVEAIHVASREKRCFRYNNSK